MEQEGPPAKKARVDTFGSSTVEERDKLIADAVSKRTVASTNTWITSFEDYCKKIGEHISYKDTSAEDLASILERYYVDARKQDGSEYRRSSFIAARSAINRHLSAFSRDIDIIRGHHFKKANKVLDAVLKAKQKDGREPAVQHKKPITDDDWTRINEHFSDISTTLDPRKVTTYVWFQVSSHFCLRGGELQSRLRKQDLVFTVQDGVERITLGTDFQTKNHRGGLAGAGYVTKGSIQDPVQVNAIKRYLEKLHPDIDRLFQRCLLRKGEVFSKDVSCWFMKSPLSHNVLDSMMRMLSEAASLAAVYTNHCVRATSIVHLKEGGVQDRQIMSVTGHRNVQSIASYDYVSPADASKFSAAIDKKSDSTAVQSDCATSVSVAAPVPAVASVESGSSVPGVLLNANGASFSHVSFNIVHNHIKKKPRYSLNLKERRRLKAHAKKE